MRHRRQTSALPEMYINHAGDAVLFSFSAGIAIAVIFALGIPGMNPKFICGYYPSINQHTPDVTLWVVVFCAEN